MIVSSCIIADCGKRIRRRFCQRSFFVRVTDETTIWGSKYVTSLLPGGNTELKTDNRKAFDGAHTHRCLTLFWIFCNIHMTQSKVAQPGFFPRIIQCETQSNHSVTLFVVMGEPAFSAAQICQPETDAKQRCQKCECERVADDGFHSSVCPSQTKHLDVLSEQVFYTDLCLLSS